MSPMKWRTNLRASLRVRKGLEVLSKRDVCGIHDFQLIVVDVAVCGGFQVCL